MIINKAEVKGDLSQGAIYETVICEPLIKAGIEPYNFTKESEIDFVISYNGFSTLVEAKAKTGNTKLSKQ